MLAVPSNLSNEMAQSILNACAAELMEKEAQADRRRRVFECDQEFRAYEKMQLPIFGPLVRASTYAKPHRLQEIAGWAFTFDPRRPVCMRGSRATMIAIHSRSSVTASNGYCREVLARYLRMQRLTLVDADDLRETIHKIEMRICRKHSPYQYREGSISRDMVMIGGRFVVLNQHQLEYVRKLSAIVKKTGKLDRILAAANGDTP